MLKFKLIVLLLILALFGTTLSAQEDDLPVVAILKYGDLNSFNSSHQGSLDLFEAYGYRDGENIEFILGEGQLNPTVAADLVQFALDQNPDVIITTSTSMLIAAEELTRDLDNPPMIIFNVVASAEAVGIAQSPCLKPSHITGSTVLPPYEFILPQLLSMGPQIERIGIMYNTDEAQSIVNVELIEAVAAEIGLDVFSTPVTSSNVVPATAEAMIGADIDAFFIQPDSTVRNALQSINALADLAGIPVITVDSSQVADGASVGMGLDYYRSGVEAARIAVHYLNGNIDIETTAINNLNRVNMGVNLDSALRQNFTFSSSFLASTNFVVENGVSSEAPPALETMSLEDRVAEDLTYFEGIYCSTARIAEEQAELES